MPYRKTSSLPKGAQALPMGAQTIYMKAFNNAFRQYASPEKRRGSSSREETAHKVAWAAVKNAYAKRAGRWKKK